MDTQIWTVQRIMDWTQSYFAKAGIESARLDTEVLLAHVLQEDRIFLYTHFDRPLSATERDQFRAMVKRRAQREPVAYILGEKEFYGRPFLVNQYTLIPRPETEHLIDGVLKWEKQRRESTCAGAPLKVLDIGTGTGCIGITLAAEIENCEVTAVDICGEALKIAETNAAALGVESKMRFLQGDLLSSVAGEEFNLIVSNPPYVEEKQRANLSPDVVDFEPESALFAGDDGMNIIRRLVVDAALSLEQGGLFAMEFGSTQRELVESCVGDSWAHYWIEKDLQGHPRAFFANRS